MFCTVSRIDMIKISYPCLCARTSQTKLFSSGQGTLGIKANPTETRT